jgi:hypothetical protein
MSGTRINTTGRFIFDPAQAFRSTVQMRPSDKYPKMGNCPIGLRRICGVCTHFGGDNIRAVGPCDKLGGDVRGEADAAECATWSRKSAAPQGGR